VKSELLAANSGSIYSPFATSPLAFQRITSGRFARFASDSTARGSFASPLTQKILHKLLGMLNASSRRSFAIPRPSRSHIFGMNDRKRGTSKTHILSVFSASRENLHVTSLDRISHPVQAHQPRSSRRNIWCAARANTLHQAKTLVFLSRCSNPNAVFAIPVGTVRHRHSLIG
jgi:hypothetical protein